MGVKIKHFWVSENCDKCVMILLKDNKKIVFKLKDGNGWGLTKKINNTMNKFM